MFRSPPTHPPGLDVPCPAGPLLQTSLGWSQAPSQYGRGREMRCCTGPPASLRPCLLGTKGSSLYWEAGNLEGMPDSPGGM